ncbi:amidohydrolase [Paracoccus liaowanqingii]|uniref:Amidohydrolase n=1 Tax=Paracoccus liaowanqingii TaxID=2560053 RepID=A0A4P7HMP1_9RHOB|nr:amidohydrolase [Paracoccus liaowanqingii]QBX34953.1 amidohydrolase [Paracoccus liaowanqingii]
MDTTTLVIRNARVLTMDADAPPAQAVAVAGDRIAAVGDDAEIMALAGPDTRIIDAKGGALLPGFVESHLHLFSGGAGLTLLQLADVRGRDALSTAIRDYARDKPDEGLLICQGAPYDILGGDAKPDRHALDEIIADRPVIVMAFDFHTAWANTVALGRAGLLDGARMEDGNEVVMGDDGKASGALHEKGAFGPVLDLRTTGGREMLGMSGREPSSPPTPEERAEDMEMIRAGLRHCAAAGITSIHNMDGNRYTLDLLREIREAGDLLARVEVPYHLTADKPLSALDEACAISAEFDDPMLSCGRIKIFVDGVIESGTAVFVDDYADRPGHKGTPLFSDRAFREAAIEADRRGLQISVHAIGDGAVRITLDGYQAARDANGERDSRHRIEHIELITEQDLPRLAALGVIASIQPLHPPGVRGEGIEPAASAIGPDRWPLAYAWRRILDTGVDYCFASDWPIVPVEPLLSIGTALQRKPWGPPMPDQRVSLDELLEGYTWRGARAGFAEDRVGRIRPGMLADLVLLPQDPHDMAPEAIAAMTPRLTVCDGRITFEADA